jgi:hypothetical protein
MPVSSKELIEAHFFVSSSNGDAEAYLCKETGKIYWRSELAGEDDCPDDVEDEDKYLAVPDKRQLDLGKHLALEFAQEFLPNDYEDIRDIFRRKGAYRRFKDLLERKGALDAWYDFEEKAQTRALREWCEANGFEVTED